MGGWVRVGCVRDAAQRACPLARTCGLSQGTGSPALEAPLMPHHPLPADLPATRPLAPLHALRTQQRGDAQWVPAAAAPPPAATSSTSATNFLRLATSVVRNSESVMSSDCREKGRPHKARLVGVQSLGRGAAGGGTQHRGAAGAVAANRAGRAAAREARTRTGQPARAEAPPTCIAPISCAACTCPGP